MNLRHAQGKRPGDRLRSLARRFCSDDTLKRVIDPLIADLQFEGASVRGRVLGYLAFWQTVGLCATRSAAGGMRAWAAADSHAIGRTLGYSAAIITALVCLLALMPLAAVLQRADVHPKSLTFLYIVPQAIPLAMAFGLPLGILVGLRGRPATTRIQSSVIGLAVICGALAFVVCAWVIPETNQAFRESLFNPPRFLARGANELTLAELTARLAALKSTSGVEARAYVLSFHTRLAASVAPVVWGIFALSLASVTRRTLLSTAIFVLAAIIYIAFATFVIAGGTDTFFWLPIAYVIWLPNVLFALMTLPLWIAARTSRASDGRATG
jgi:lipopolysaccharide export LptBFGC system permease protein LptF